LADFDGVTRFSTVFLAGVILFEVEAIDSAIGLSAREALIDFFTDTTVLLTLLGVSWCTMYSISSAKEYPCRVDIGILAVLPEG
jgi:hypothetical protein